MAGVYKVSADMSEAEKIVGGILTLGQGAWLALGFIIIAGIFLLLVQFLPPIAAIILALPPGLAIALPFAFYKKNGLPLVTYLRYKREFKKKTMYLINTLTYGKDFPDEEGI